MQTISQPPQYSYQQNPYSFGNSTIQQSISRPPHQNLGHAQQIIGYPQQSYASIPQTYHQPQYVPMQSVNMSPQYPTTQYPTTQYATNQYPIYNGMQAQVIGGPLYRPGIQYNQPSFNHPIYQMQPAIINRVSQHPQRHQNLNFDYDQANFLCDAKIQQSNIYCVLCQEEYRSNEKQAHIQKHIRKPQQQINGESISRLEKYQSQLAKKKHKIKPIVQPQQYNVQYDPNTFTLHHEINYEQQIEPSYHDISVGESQAFDNTLYNPYKFMTTSQKEEYNRKNNNALNFIPNQVSYVLPNELKNQHQPSEEQYGSLNHQPQSVSYRKENNDQQGLNQSKQFQYVSHPSQSHRQNQQFGNSSRYDLENVIAQHSENREPLSASKQQQQYQNSANRPVSVVHDYSSNNIRGLSVRRPDQEPLSAQSVHNGKIIPEPPHLQNTTSFTYGSNNPPPLQQFLARDAPSMDLRKFPDDSESLRLNKEQSKEPLQYHNQQILNQYNTSQVKPHLVGSQVNQISFDGNSPRQPSQQYYQQNQNAYRQPSQEVARQPSANVVSQPSENVVRQPSENFQGIIQNVSGESSLEQNKFNPNNLVKVNPLAKVLPNQETW